MLIVLKTIILFFLIIFVLPLVFFLLVGGVGKYFSLTINKDCWLAKTNIRWVKSIVSKFIV